MITFLKKIYSKLFTVSMTNYDIHKSNNYLETLGIPKDNFEASYFQYKCQSLPLGKIQNVIRNVLSIAFYHIYYVKNQNNTIHSKENYDAIMLSDAMDLRYIPNSLKNNYKKIIKIDIEKNYHLTKSDLFFIKKIKRLYPYSFFFRFKVMMKIAEYSYYIQKYNISAIFTNAEFSFASSILTEYCKINNIKHINLMHGEKLLYIRDAFATFDTFYVWDDYYVYLLKKLKENSEFIVEKPEFLNMNLSDKYIDHEFTYYFADETEEILYNIKSNLDSLKKQYNANIYLRPHPRYSNIAIIKKIFKDYYIENIQEINIEESLKKCYIPISVYSTVLFQAYINGKKICIDNLSNPKLYNKLDDLEYMFTKTNRNIKFSDLLGEN